MVTKPLAGAIDSRELRGTSQKSLLDSSVSKHKCQGRTNQKKLQKSKRVDKMNKGIWYEQAENPRKSSNFGCSLFGSYFFRGEEFTWMCHQTSKAIKEGSGLQPGICRAQIQIKQSVTEKKPKKTKFCSSGTKWTKLKNEVCPTSSEKGERKHATKTCIHSFSLLKCGHVFFQNTVSERSTGDVHRNWLRFSRGRGVLILHLSDPTHLRNWVRQLSYLHVQSKITLQG